MAELYCPKCHAAMAVDIDLDGPAFMACPCGVQYVPGRISRLELEEFQEKYRNRPNGNAGRKRHIPVEIQHEVVREYNRGYSSKEVARKFGISTSTVLAYAKKFGATTHRQGRVCEKERIL